MCRPTHSLITLLVMLAACSVSGARMTSDSARLYRSVAGKWIACRSDSTYTFAHGDSLQALKKARIFLSPTCSVSAAAGSRLSLSVQDTTATIHLQTGQCFIRRTPPYTYASVSLHTLGCHFRLAGTQAALKITPNGLPTVAVIEGTVIASTPNGQNTPVSRGMYATLDPRNNRARTGELSREAVSQILAWSGIGTLPPEKEAAPAETPSAAATDSAADTPARTGPAAAAGAIDTTSAQAADTAGRETSPARQQQTQAPETEETQEAASQAAAAPAAGPSGDQPATAADAPADTTDRRPPQDTGDQTDTDVAGTRPPSAPGTAPHGEAAGTRPADTGAQAAGDQDTHEEKDAQEPSEPQGTNYALSVGSVTIDGEQWTRIAFGIDVPIWKFGVFFDLEVFLTDSGTLSDKGWRVDNGKWQDFMLRKIRYVRFGRESDPLFVKLGGLDNVTMGYGFIVDGFTNMLHYPDEKLLGLQLRLNDLSAVNFSLHAMTPDLQELAASGGEYAAETTGGIVAARASLTPLARLSIPFVSAIRTGAAVGIDRNQYAPVRDWVFLDGPADDRDEDGIIDSTAPVHQIYRDSYTDGLPENTRRSLIDAGQYDTLIRDEDQWARETTNDMIIAGVDAGMPLWEHAITQAHVYGHAAARFDTAWADDGRHDWGFGFPGVSLSVWKFRARVEYRHIEGKFEPGYFNRYYLSERISRYPHVYTKEDSLSSANLNGIFGSCGFSLSGVLTLSGTYQRMAGEAPAPGAEKALDQRFHATASAGEKILERIPRLSRAMFYFDKTAIQRTWVYDTDGTRRYDRFFEKTPSTYYGYRAGIQLADAAMLVADMRYGWHYEIRDGSPALVPDNNLRVETVLQF
jgi:hypothetical protein